MAQPVGVAGPGGHREVPGSQKEGRHQRGGRKTPGAVENIRTGCYQLLPHGTMVLTTVIIVPVAGISPGQVGLLPLPRVYHGSL